MPETGRALRILAVDDSSAAADLALQVLRTSRFELVADVATTHAEFIVALSARHYDLVLTDYRMLGWNGFDALELIRAKGLDIPVILLSGTLGDENAVECVKRGMADLVEKGNLSRLPLAVRRALDEARVRSDRRNAEERFEQLAGSIEEIVFSMDSQFHETIFINRAYERIWGRTCESLYADPTSFFEGLHPDDRAGFEASVARLQLGEEPRKIEFRIIRPDGTERHLLANAAPVRDARGNVYRISGVAHDVTETRRLEEQFRHAQKLDAVGRLAAGVAHDFNNLLTVIGSYATFLDDGLVADDPLHADVEEIVSAVDSAATLTRQLLVFSRQEVVQPRIVAVDSVLENTLKLLLRLLGESIEVITRDNAPGAAVCIDPGHLEQIIMNLALNARDAMPSGGQLIFEISIEKNELEPPSLPSVVLSVIDTGVGMTARTRRRLFEPFFTTKAAGKGTGLGLATVHAIVEQSGGHITVASESGHGSTFTVRLPLVAPSSAEAAPAATTVETLDGTETVLVVEDAPAVRAAIARVLRRRGYAVLEAADGRSALEFAIRRTGRIHLLLTDVVMPLMSGRDLAAQFTARSAGTKVLYMSGYTDDEVIRTGVMTDELAYIKKPFRTDALARRVRDVLDAKV